MSLVESKSLMAGKRAGTVTSVGFGTEVMPKVAGVTRDDNGMHLEIVSTIIWVFQYNRLVIELTR
jgi:hypothetical protein